MKQCDFNSYDGPLRCPSSPYVRYLPYASNGGGKLWTGMFLYYCAEAWELFTGHCNFCFSFTMGKKRRRMCLSFSYEQDIFHLDPQEIKYCC